MKIKCLKCQKIFDATTQQEQFINQSKSKNMSLIFIECSDCHRNVPVNPSDLLSQESPKIEKDSLIKCPICDGMVSFIENDTDGNFYGCGECGSIWRKQENLMKDISEVKAGKTIEYKSFKRD